MAEQSVHMQQRVQAQSYASPPANTLMNESTSIIREIIHSSPPTIRNVKSASGWRQPSPYSAVHEEWTPYLSGEYFQTFYGRPDDWWVRILNSCNYPSGKISLPEYDDSHQNRAVVKALLKLKGQKVNLSQMVGERAEAAHMMAKTVEGIARSVRWFKHEKPKDWLKVIRYQTGHGADAKSIPRSWLELQYGWKPLMQDVHGIVQSLNERERDGDAYRATVSATVKETYKKIVRLNAAAYSRVDVHLEGVYGCKVRLDYVLENPVLATLSQLGITNPATLAWELLPYSFVADWFLPVGDYLSAFDAALGWQFKGGSSTYFARQQGQGKAFAYDSEGYYHGVYNTGVYSCKQFKFNRNIFLSSPLPRIPSLKNPFSTGHVANAMSLLATSLRPGKKR